MQGTTSRRIRQRALFALLALIALADVKILSPWCALRVEIQLDWGLQIIPTAFARGGGMGLRWLRRAQSAKPATGVLAEIMCTTFAL